MEQFDINNLKQLTNILYQPESVNLIDEIDIKTGNTQTITISAHNLKINLPWFSSDDFKTSNLVEYLQGSQLLKSTEIYQGLYTNTTKLLKLLDSNTNQLDSVADTLVCGKFTIVLSGNSNTRSQLEQTTKLIIGEKVKYLQAELASLSKLNIHEYFCHPESTSNSTTAVNSTHSSMYELKINRWTSGLLKHIPLSSNNLIFTGGLLYDAINCPNADFTDKELRDIDIFLFGQELEKQKIINKIISNLKSAYGEALVHIGYFRSVISIGIGGFARIVQIINFSGQTPQDVIGHFDMKHLQVYWDGTKLVNTWTPGNLQLELSGPNTKPKLYRLLKAKSKGFNITGAFDTHNLFFARELAPLKKAKNINEYWTQTMNLTKGFETAKWLNVLGMYEYKEETLVKSSNFQDYVQACGLDNWPQSKLTIGLKESIGLGGGPTKLFEVIDKTHGNFYFVTNVLVHTVWKSNCIDYSSNVVQFEISNSNTISLFNNMVTQLVNELAQINKNFQLKELAIPLMLSNGWEQLKQIDKRITSRNDTNSLNKHDEHDEFDSHNKSWLRAYENKPGLFFRKSFDGEKFKAIQNFTPGQTSLVKISFKVLARKTGEHDLCVKVEEL
jgi:hypothetical protein